MHHPQWLHPWFITTVTAVWRFMKVTRNLASDRIWTCNLWIWSPALYPFAWTLPLKVHTLLFSKHFTFTGQVWDTLSWITSQSSSDICWNLASKSLNTFLLASRLWSISLRKLCTSKSHDLTILSVILCSCKLQEIIKQLRTAQRNTVKPVSEFLQLLRSLLVTI